MSVATTAWLTVPLGGGGAVGANPTGTIGLTAVNGAATTFLRSDGAPALDVGIAPTWTAVHTFSQAIGATSTDGIVLSNPTAATVGAQKWSPRLHLHGSGWGTTGGAAQDCDWKLEVQPAQGSTQPSNILVIAGSINGGAYTTFATLSGVGAGSLTVPSLIASNSVVSGNIFARADTVGFFVGTADDCRLGRAAAANWQFGAAAANPPIAQTLSVQDASGTDIAGAAWTFRGSRGTGAGLVTGKSFIWQTPDVLGSGTTLQTATEKMSLTGDGILTVTGKIVATKAIRLASYTVGTLPAANAGDTAIVTDALGPTYGAAVVGGGAVTTPVFYAAAWNVG